MGTGALNVGVGAGAIVSMVYVALFTAESKRPLEQAIARICVVDPMKKAPPYVVAAGSHAGPAVQAAGSTPSVR